MRRPGRSWSRESPLPLVLRVRELWVGGVGGRGGLSAVERRQLSSEGLRLTGAGGCFPWVAVEGQAAVEGRQAIDKRAWATELVCNVAGLC